MVLSFQIELALENLTKLKILNVARERNHAFWAINFFSDTVILILVMVMNLYSAFSINIIIQMHFTSKGSMGEIGHRHIIIGISPST